MYLSQTDYGKAYEYACLMAIRDYLATKSDAVTIDKSDAFKTAENAFLNAEEYGIDDNLVRAANAAVRVITRLEPQLEHGDKDLKLVIQTDAKGIGGDVRDVLCIRNRSGWEVGLSCKHNHHAVKHSRLSSTIDFGKEWFGIPCSQTYFETIVPIFNELKEMRDEAVRNHASLPLWNDLPNKAERYYIPILKAFLVELRRLVANNPDVPGRLIHYMLGRYDFYKVITDDSHETTRVEAINIAGTLNRPANGRHSIVNVPRLKLPTRFYHLDFVPGFDNKIEVVCDEGWALTMRIHNASSRIEPSLKFDVQLVSLPSSIHVQVEPW